MSQVEDIITKAMTASKAWPAVFEAGSAAELTRAVLVALDAAGFVMVPKEPTPEMMEAAFTAMFVDRWNGTQAPMIGAGYDATIGARPK